MGGGAARSEAEGVSSRPLRSLAQRPVGERRRARFHALPVAEVRPLTADAVEVSFVVPDELRDEYEYLPGQYVALRATVDGKELRRSYSLCRAPSMWAGAAGGPSTGSGVGDGGRLSVAIKRDIGGRFSRWAQTELRPGDTIDVMSPQGTFTLQRDELDGARIAAIAAGSGITPVMALASTVLACSDTAAFTLVYTNRSTIDVMFLEDLADLKDRYPTRFALHHVLSREQRSAPLLSGRLDGDRLRRILDALVLPETIDEWFLCGPIELVKLCRDTLAEFGVPRERIRHELFTSVTTGATGATGDVGGAAPGTDAPQRPPASRPDGPVTTIDLTLDGHSTRVLSPVDAHESILDAALRVRPDAPFACAGGVCGTCRARLVSGSVQMTENYALEPEELAAGYVLTCQSHPTSPEISVDYDV